MTVADTRRRPSPTPRTETPPEVTERVTETCNAVPTDAPAERETPETGPSKLQSAITVGKRVWGRSLTYWTLPPLLGEQPPTAEKIAEYARNAAYTNPTGLRRNLGIGWCYGIAVPALAAGRVFAWSLERPGRFVTISATVKLCSFLPPVAWATDHLIAPAADLALRLFL